MKRGRRLTVVVSQKGAAVVMAMLVVAITAIMVTGAFHRQSIMARSLENAMAASQVHWLMAGAVDWVRVILNEDARASTTDHLAEPWAVPLAQTRLNDDERDPAWLSGMIEDGQSRINLRNLVGAEEPVASEVAVLARLLTIIGENERLAVTISESLQATFGSASVNGGEAWALPATVDDLEFVLPNHGPVMEKLRPYVTLLPVPTPVNANTASAEVLAARFRDLTLADARRLVSSRDRASFKDIADLSTRLSDVELIADAGKIGVASRFFVLDGSIEFRRARLRQTALLRREPGRVDIVWLREVRT